MNDIKLIMNDFYDYLKKEKAFSRHTIDACLLYTSDAADE